MKKNEKSKKQEKHVLSPSDEGNKASSQNSKGCDKSGTNESTKKNNVEGIKKYKPAMTGRAYKALFKRQPKKCEALGKSIMNASRDENDISSSSANLELQKVLVDETSLETDINLALKRKRDREGMLDASVTVAKETLDSGVPFEKSIVHGVIDEITKKRKTAAGNITETPGGASERPEVPALPSSPRSASGFSGTLNENIVSGLYSMGNSISRIPEHMLASRGRGQTPYESQESLHGVLKLEIPKLFSALHLSENWRCMVEKFLEYVIKNYRVYEEPTTALQAFQIALIWVAALLVQQKLNRKESLACAKSKLAFSCSTQEAEYMYSILYCMKSIFLEQTQGLQMDCSGSATKDVEKTKSYIKKKCNKQAQKLLQKHEEKKMELAKMNDDKKKELEARKFLEASLLRIHAHTCTQGLWDDDIKQLDHVYNRKFDELKSEMDECLKSLEKMHEAAKKELTEDEACWIDRIDFWAQAELSVLVKDSNNKHFGEICSSNTNKNAIDTQTLNDSHGESTYADSNCMVSKESREAIDFRLQGAENDLVTTTGGSVKQDGHEMVAIRNSKETDASIMSRQQPKSKTKNTTRCTIC